jgi:hypothetical protein
MATSKQTNTGKPIKPQKQPTSTYLFGKDNYVLMLVGVIILASGFILMVGGKSTDPTKFNDNEIYSTTRITIAPILILTGFIIEIFAIMKQPKKAE